jgi:phenylacetate-CoA ligase
MDFHKYLYLAGERFKNPHLKDHLNWLMKTDFATLQELEDIQLKRLKKLLHFAKDNTNFYKERLRDIDIDNLTLEKFKEQVPILTKDELKANADDLRCEVPGESLIKAETSGTTGDVFLFNKNIHWDASFRAAQYRGYSWYGVKPWEKSLYFWGFKKAFKDKLKIRILDFLLNRYRFFDYTHEEFERAADRIRESSYIAGYSSSIHMMAEYFKKRGYKFDNIKMVKGTAEKVYESYHKSVKEVFGRKITSEYGSAEAGVIAYECPQGNMHIVMENVIVEEIDGKIIVTNLWAYSLPFIRFELGDLVVLDEETKCPCGREHKIIKEVTGRIGRKLHGKKNLYSTININHTFKNLSFKYGIELAYSAKQYKKGEMVFDITKDDSIDEDLAREKLKESAFEYFKDDMDIVVNFVEYKEGKEKKQKDFESFIEEDIEQ